MKTLAEVSYLGLRFLEFKIFIETNPGWQELPSIRTNFHSWPQPVRAIEVLLYILNDTNESAQHAFVIARRKQYAYI